MKKVTIPTCANPFVVIINGRKYTYPAGETMEVPDEVADVIEWHIVSQPKPDPALDYNGGGGVASLNIHYGLFEPKDTSKLWVKTSEPSGVIVSSEKVFAEGGQEEDLDEYKISSLSYTNCGVAAVGTSIYSLGGRTSGSVNGFTKIVRLNAETNTATTLGVELPYGLVWTACATYGTKIYLFGGKSVDDVNNGSSVIFYDSIIEFDTDTLEVKELETKLPVKMYAACACCVGSKIYIFGGNDRTSKKLTKQILIFDPETKKVETAPCVLPTASADIACASVGDKIYLFGGKNTMTDIRCYNTLDNSIDLLTEKLPEGRINIGCSAVDHVICLIGGSSQSETNISGSTHSIWTFDTVTNKVKVSDLQTTNWMTNAKAVTVERRVYSMQANSSGWVFEYTPKIGTLALDAGKLQLYPSLSMNLFQFINTPSVKAEMGVEMVHKGNKNNESELVEAALYKDGAWTNI